MEITQHLKVLDDDVATELTVAQYRNPREQRQTDEATADLEGFMLDLFKDAAEPKPSVTWGDIELKNENGDWRPAKSTAITQETPLQTVCDVLDEYCNRSSVKSSIRKAEKIEARATSIDCYELKKIEFDNSKMSEYFTILKPKVTAVIDWLKLQMTISPTYAFSHPTKKFQDIRKFLKDHGINGNAYVEQLSINTFTVDIHDLATGEQFEKIMTLLHMEYGATDMRITTLELSLDFWHVGMRPLLLALAKSVHVGSSITDRDFRVYLSGTQYRTIPHDPRKAMKYINKGYTIGIGHRNNDDVYIRAYFKRMDHSKPLPLDQRRMRIEVNLSGQALADLGDEADNLKHLINKGFKFLQFTKLNDKATVDEAKHYHNNIEMFGRETSIISKSRHKRELPDFIKSHADLNRVISKAVDNLSRKF